MHVCCNLLQATETFERVSQTRTRSGYRECTTMGRFRQCLEVRSSPSVPETIASDRRCTRYWRRLSVRNHNLEIKTASNPSQQNLI